MTKISKKIMWGTNQRNRFLLENNMCCHHCAVVRTAEIRSSVRGPLKSCMDAFLCSLFCAFTCIKLGSIQYSKFVSKYIKYSSKKRMGLFIAKNFTERDIMPQANSKPTFDPMFGFPNGRKPRKAIATEDEMFSMNVPPNLRDYCAHKFINYKACMDEKFPFNHHCNFQKHEYLHCQYEDAVLRMKEFERERRLRKRQKRIEERRAKEAGMQAQAA